MGISVNRWEPWNAVQAVQSGLIDGVQVIYKIFDEDPEDELFPACRAGDRRNTYFVPENLAASVEHADALKPLMPAGMAMLEMALRFILRNGAVSRVIPGMRRLRHAETNVAASDAGPLQAKLLARLRLHRWDRQPSGWLQ